MKTTTNPIESALGVLGQYKILAEKAIAQLSDEDFFKPPEPESNSIAIIVKHMSGNMLSRFTDFLTTDGEKEWRNRVDLADQASLDWQRKIASFIVDEESRLPVKHLIAQNFCNFGYPIANLDENIRILNFHYAFPEAVALNYGYGRVMSFDESGFSGSDDAAYRRQAWKFILAGGGIFNSLDYSFYPGAEGGSGENQAPGGGSPALRKQLGILKRFIEDFDYLSMGPDSRAVRLSPACRWQALANRYREFAIYVEGESSCPVTLNLYPGDWHAEWLDTRTGEVVKTQDVNSNGVSTRLETPAFEGDIALRVRRR